NATTFRHTTGCIRAWSQRLAASQEELLRNGRVGGGHLSRRGATRGFRRGERCLVTVVDVFGAGEAAQKSEPDETDENGCPATDDEWQGEVDASHEPAEHRPERHASPQHGAPGSVDASEEAAGDDALAQRHDEDVPHGDGA